jgi:hypothetical protein
MKYKFHLLMFLIFISFQKGKAQYVVITSGGNFDANSTVNVVFNGESIQNNGGTYYDPLSNTYLTGSSNVIIAGNNYMTFGNLTVNNSSGASAVTLNKKVHTETLLTFTNGIVVSTLTNNLTFNANSTVTGAADASHVNGPVRKAGGADFIFPVGNASYYRLAAVTAHASVDTFTTTYFVANPTVVYGTPKDVTINHISPYEYWTINRLGVVDNAKVTLSWNSNTSGVIASINDIIVVRWDGAQWRDHGGTSRTGSTSNGTVITPALVTSFSPFTLGSTTSASLPIALLDFHTSCNGKNVLISWTTGSEKNNASFLIEKSDDAKNFVAIGKVNGAGNSTLNLEYSLLDTSPPSSGTAYYRLSQFDYDNAKTVLGIRSVNTAKCNGDKSSIDFVFTAVDEIKIIFTALQEGEVITNIYSTNGSSVHTFRNMVIKGQNAIAINVSDFSAGMYFINCRQNSDASRAKVVLSR